MPTTRLHRLLAIVTLVQARSTWTAKTLATECGVDERTIYRDLNDLAESGIPITFDDQAGGYRINADFFLPAIHLSIEETLALTLLCEEIAKPQQIPFTLPAWKALAKIQSTLPQSIREEASERSRNIAVRTSQAISSDDDADVYQRMLAATVNRKALVCRYESLDPTSSQDLFDFEPYSLFFCVRAWYAIGFHSGRQAVRCLKLNRFTKVSPTQRPYDIPADYSLDAFLGNAWRMIRGTPETDVVLEFTPSFAQTVGDTLWHRTQSLDYREDGSALFRCRVAGFDEISWWILSHGPNCRVIEPPALRDLVRDLAARTAALY
ncbi:MAG: WYL domain-containing protein [Phycisphaerae bacterium]